LRDSYKGGETLATIEKQESTSVGGWTAWCQSVRGIPRESRNPVVRKTPCDGAPQQDKSHAG
jgi:hypothetical protein